MNRKARLWNKDSQSMIYLGSGIAYVNGGEPGYSSPVYGIRFGNTTNGRYGREELINGKVMYSVGLLDKEGTEIYEGDIVEHSHTMKRIAGTTRFEPEMHLFTFKSIEYLYGRLLPSETRRKIVGNIYEIKKGENGADK